MDDRKITIIVVVVFVLVGIFFIWRDYKDFVFQIIHPSPTASSNSPLTTTNPLKNIYGSSLPKLNP